MPCNWGGHRRSISKRLRAWTRHYQAKGCSSTKAADVAWRKVRRKNTWPPALPA